ncbi:MAG: pyruvate dehydrogenase (acetyl-transferring) E1 component subunit alpha [Panacagrimonas sp.]
MNAMENPVSDETPSCESVVARFEVRLTRFLDAEGAELAPLPPFATAEELRRMYGVMVETRAIDRKAVSLQRTGQLGTYASGLGQEAIGVATGLALRNEDILIPAYRDYAAQFLRGVPPESTFLYWAGDERSMCFPQGTPSFHDFPFSVPIATHVPQAIGVAYAVKLRKQARVVVAACGDGATSKGDFYEAVSSAKVWNLPLVFLVSNNQWAISMPRARQTGAGTIAQKAIAGGIPGEQVDGNDVIATRYVIERALAAARAGEGPRLIEAITYRLHDHTTADDARRYRSEDEVRAAWERCPIKRLRACMEARGCWSAAEEESLATQAAGKADAVARAYLAVKPEAPEAIFDSLYAHLPRAFDWQRAEVIAAGSKAH